MKDGSRAFEAIYVVSELAIIILYLLFTEYGKGVYPEASGSLIAEDAVLRHYAMFQDVHVMIFIGFGFLSAFLKTHSWTSVGYNFLIAAYALQITILVKGFWMQALMEPVDEWSKIQINIRSLLRGDFGAATVLITFQAVLGKCSLVQLWALATFEIIFYTLNSTICGGLLGAVDMGGSMYVHVFGCYFGLAASYFFDNNKAIKDAKSRCEGNYTSQLLAIGGTIFLWMYWPSAHAALAKPSQRERVIVNTVLAITASCISAGAVSRIWLQRLSVDVILYATLAGGVAIGTSCDLIATGGIAIAIGAIGGTVSAFCVIKLGPYLGQKISLHDTCGVNNLHGVPGLIGAIIGAIAASLADSWFDQAALEETFPKIADGRTTSEQGWIQLCALGITLGISIIAGTIAGFLASRCGKLEELFEDSEHFANVKYDVVDLQQMKNEILETVPDTARALETEIQEIK